MNIVYPTTSGICSNLDFYVTRFCLPIKKSCEQTCTELLITSEDQIWNCNLCETDCEFFVRYDSGDKIMFQTQFQDYHHVQAGIPTTIYDGFMEITLCDGDGNVVTNASSAFVSRSMAAWNDNIKSSYQLHEVNTALIDGLIGGGCWSIKIESFDANGVPKDLYHTQHFKPNDGCLDLVKMKGEFSNLDCCGNYYGEPVADQSLGSPYIAYVSNPVDSPFSYDNTIKMDGVFVDSGASISKEVFNSKKRTSVSITCPFNLQPNNYVPPYFKNIIFKQVLGAEKVFINDVEYTFDEGSVSNLGKKGRMFNFVSTLNSICELRYKC